MYTDNLELFVEMSYRQQLNSKIGDRICPLLIGPPGIGKTMFIEQLAKRHGKKLFTLILAQANPSEVAGIVMPVNDSKVVDIYDPKWVDELEDGDILFFDEALKAPIPTLNSCLTMIQERRLTSNRKLPNVALFAASNWDKSFRNIKPEVRQRFHRVNVEWSPTAWREYMRMEYKFDVTNELVGHIKMSMDEMDNGDHWNILTPRECTKILLWMRGTKDEGERVLLSLHLQDSFGGATVNQLKEVAGWNKKKTEKEQLFELFQNFTRHGDGPESVGVEENGLFLTWKERRTDRFIIGTTMTEGIDMLSITDKQDSSGHYVIDFFTSSISEICDTIKTSGILEDDVIREWMIATECPWTND